MAQQTDKSDQKYRSLRNDFDNLQLEEKAVFLIESGLSLFIHGIESLTTLVRDEVNKFTDEMKDEPESAETVEEPEKKEAPKRKTRSTASKRKSSKSTTSSNNKTTPKDDAASDGDQENSE